MSDKKQIDEMAKTICKYYEDDKYSCGRCPDCYARDEAKKLYNAGYRKQSEGEWILVSEYGGGWYVGDKRVFPKYCSVCKATYTYGPYNYCPNCGANMKGADNDRAD